MRCRARLVLVAAVLVCAALPAPASAPAPAYAPAPARACAASPLCVCSGDHFACSHVPFYRFPETEPWVAHVSVWRARLGALAAAALDARRLRTLVLAACRLHALHPAALRSMEDTLASLDLGHNEFTELPMEALRELKVLNWLNLQNNQISEIYENLDWGHLSESLTSLSLSHNRLSVVPAGALAALRRLASLELEGNRLRALAPGALPPALARLLLADNLLPRAPCLPRLRHLALRNNLLAPRNHSCPPDRSRVRFLDLSQNELDDLYEFDFLYGHQLEQLNLDFNDFTKVPRFSSESVRLEKLSMSHNRLRDLSDSAIRDLNRTLEHLELDYNELESLSDGIRQLSRLRYLSLAYNRLRELPELPPRLQWLSAAGNDLSSVPRTLRALEGGRLAHLDLGYNRIASLPREAFGAWAAALGALSLRGNRLTHLAPDAFAAPLPVRELALSFNDLLVIHPDAFVNLTKLRVLELSSSLFKGEFPLEAVSDDLTWLTLDNNNIHYVTSDDILRFSSLEFLNLEFNKIVEFPSDTNCTNFIYDSSKLKELRLSYNYVKIVKPDFLTKLTELESLDLSHNRMQNVIERCFASLRNLVYLSLAGNDLEFIAERAFHDLSKLEVLELQENHLAEFGTGHFSEMTGGSTGIAVNASHNRISSLVGGATVSMSVLDLSYNLIENLSKSFFDGIAHSITQLLLSHNRLVHIDSFSSGTLPNLRILSLYNNSISAVRGRALAAAPALLLLDASHNRLAPAAEQFSAAPRLRQLRLAANGLRALPPAVFRGTQLELLDLSDNRLAVFPGSALAHVGGTLRRLDLARNRLEHLDAAMFRATASLHELNLSQNALTVLADNTFSSLSRLTRLDLSRNAIKSNFRELFHNLPSLRWLSLADADLPAVPPMPLPNLTQLDLGGNRIASYREADVRWLSNLRHLDVARNRIASLRPAMWAALPRLARLDVSHNPVARIAGASFEGLGALVELRMERLRRLEALEPRAFQALRALRALALELPAGGAALADVAAALPGLEALTLALRARALDAQLAGVRGARLVALEVRGAALQQVSALALGALGRQRALWLRLRGTRVRALPAGLLRPLARVPLLALDLSDNRLEELDPAALCSNRTDWHRRATKFLSGGLVASGNALQCGCGVRGVGAWLRRWAAEAGAGAGAGEGAGGVAAARRGGWCAAGARRVALLAPAAALPPLPRRCPAPRAAPSRALASLCALLLTLS